MKDAATTWAVVVGIDAYAELKPLTGAVADAAAAVTWLRRLGVPDAQILLHAAPTPQSKPVADGIGLAYGACTQPEIWPSFEKLMTNAGSRLFVILCGHGFFEPGGHRVFLTSEARQLVMSNLHIESYAAFLRGLPYVRQFLVMDGCLNLPYTASERAKFKPGEPPVELPPRPEVAQWLCTAAAQGERAVEENGHGLFLPQLLGALDLDAPNDRCVAIDETSGTIVLDLAAAVEDVAGPTVGARAGELGRSQHPAIQRLDAGASIKPVAVVTKAPDQTARVRVNVLPPDAVQDVRRIRLSTDDYVWESSMPKPPATNVVCPVETVLPSGMHVSVRCTMTGDGWAQPAQQEFVAADREVVFHVERPGQSPDVVVNTVDRRGEIVSGMTYDIYERVERVLAEEGVGFDHHETGPVLHAPAAFPRLPEVAIRVARTIDRETADDLAARVRGVDNASVRTALRIEVDARRLAGLLAGEEVVRIGGTAYAPDDLTEVEVEPGRVPVEVTLPWGRWSAVVTAKEGETTDVTLPSEVGLPPLRVRLLTNETGEAPGRTIASTGDAVDGVVWYDQPAGRGSSAAVGGGIKPAPDLTHWGGAMSRAVSSAPRWQGIAVVERAAVRFPLHEEGTVGLDLGAAPRAEPLSRIRAPEWDALAASGRLDEVTPEAAVELTQQKWFDPLLGLAGAYACYAHEHDEYLGVVLSNLARIDDELPDVPFLAAASDRRLGRQRPEIEEMLSRHFGVPLFRWGVGIGVLGAEHYDLRETAAKLRSVEERLVPTSVWTLWTE